MNNMSDAEIIKIIESNMEFDSFDTSAVENVKNNTDNMVDIYSKNSTKEVFSETSLSDIMAGKKVHKSVSKISNRIQNSGEFRKAQKVQEQTNREKK